MALEERVDANEQRREERFAELIRYSRDNPQAHLLRTLLEPFYGVRAALKIPKSRPYRVEMLIKTSLVDIAQIAFYMYLGKEVYHQLIVF